MALLGFIFWLALLGAVFVAVIWLVYRVVGGIAGSLSQGIWQSPIEDDATVGAWTRDTYEDHLDPGERAARRMSERRARGECAMCGYSLRGNTSGTCPECGTSTRYTSPHIRPDR